MFYPILHPIPGFPIFMLVNPNSSKLQPRLRGSKLGLTHRYLYFIAELPNCGPFLRALFYNWFETVFQNLVLFDVFTVQYYYLMGQLIIKMPKTFFINVQFCQFVDVWAS